jgi:hypothetical protein
MSETTVRRQYADWLAPPAVPFLHTVLRHPLTKNNPADFYHLDKGGGSGAWAGIYIPHQREERIAWGGLNSGKKLVIYDTVLAIRFLSKKPDALAGQDDHTALLDGLKTRIRADRTLGTAGGPNPIFSAGEGDLKTPIEAPDIVVDSWLPRTDKAGDLVIWTDVSVVIVEHVAT